MKKLLLVLLCLPIIGFGQCENRCNEIINYTNAKYSGCINEEGKPNGYGKIIFNDKQSYTGCWKNGRKEGQGSYTYADGENYSGEYKDGVFHGQGTYTWSDGGKYVGGWKDGKKNGQGIYTYADGNVWIGKWKNNEKFKGHYESQNYYDKNHIVGDVNFSIVQLEKIKNDENGSGCHNISISFNGISEDFLFDTGCSSMLINYDLLNKLRSNNVEMRKVKSSTASTASNDVIYTEKYMIKEIKLGDFTINNLVVSVTKNGSLLCGMGLFNKFSNVEWNLKESTLKLYK